MGMPLEVVLGPEADGWEQGLRGKGTQSPACPAARRPWSRRGSGMAGAATSPSLPRQPCPDSSPLSPRPRLEGPFLKVRFCPLHMGVPHQIHS